MSALAGGLLLSGCYYGYPPYPGGYYAPVVPAAYTQREFTMPPGAASTASAAGVPTASALVPASSIGRLLCRLLRDARLLVLSVSGL